MIGDEVRFDRGSPDPSPRGHGIYVYGLLFSQRCATNAIESGARALAGTPLHPRQFLHDLRSIWVSQETRREVESPLVQDRAHDGAASD